MDGLDLFKKLGYGAKFDFSRFQNDAKRLKIRNVHKQSKQQKKRKDIADLLSPVQGISEQPKQRKRKHSAEDTDSPKKSKLDYDENVAESDSDSIEEKSDDEEVDFQILGSIKAKKTKDADGEKKKKMKSDKAKAALLHTERIRHIRRKNNIHVYGSDAPEPVETFEQLREDYNVHQQIVTNLFNAGFRRPTPIQMQAVPVMLQRREILACAPTGSGKTAAFILPILHHLKEPRKLGFRALVLSPTRELATQTFREFKRLSENRGFRIFLIEKSDTAVRKFGPKSSKKFDILVTTPNRLIHLLNQDPPAVNLSNVEWLIVDESDKLFEEGKTGFRDQLGAIYQACDSPNVRRAMFSATFAHDVEQWCKTNLDNVVQVYIGDKNAATKTIKQELLFVGSEYGKLVALRDIIQKGLQPPMLIFVQSKERAKELFHELIYDGINVDVMHSDRTQTQRDNVVKGFRSGKIWVLICTELMGRGIDFKGVSVVINYDFPTSAISYIHRIGRTGRAGRRGKAVTFFTEDDAKNLRSIANVMKGAGCPVPDYMLEIKKPERHVLKKLAKSVPKRQTIRTVPKYEIQKAKDTRKKLKRQKQGKPKGDLQNTEHSRTKSEGSQQKQDKAEKIELFNGKKTNHLKLKGSSMKHKKKSKKSSAEREKSLE